MMNKIDKNIKLVIAEFHFWLKVTRKLKRDKLINASIRPVAKNTQPLLHCPLPKNKKEEN